MNTLSPYLNWNVLTAALAVIVLLIVVLVIFRAFGGTVRGRRGARLGVSEYHEIDKTRRLVLVRRDGIEHLLLIGGQSDLVIETRIRLGEADEDEFLHRPMPEPSMPAAPVISRSEEPAVRAGGGDAPPLRAAPRPPVFGDKSPPKLRPIARDEPRLAPLREYKDDTSR
jgi:Meckel syndrome type 1 protein